MAHWRRPLVVDARC